MVSALRPAGVPPVPLSALVSGLGLTGDTGSRTLVVGITLDSRAVEHGWLYVALPGARAHGARFAASAVEAGAAAILTDDEGRRILGDDPGAPVVGAEDARAAMALVSARLFGEPAAQLTTMAVTGTNGKTTTVALLQAGLAAAGRVAGTIGTIGFRLGAEELVSARGTVTTPESPDLQALLGVFVQRGADAALLEVSSHALALSRVDGIAFDVAAFLNLGRDHLDFHRDLDDYFAAKARLFEPGRAAVSVFWTDDPRGRELAQRTGEHGMSSVVTVGTHDADYVLRDYRDVAPLGGAATLRRGGEEFALALALPGRYNMIDAAVAFAMLEAVGVAPDDALRGLAAAQVPGRMQRVDLGPGAPVVVVDFAHTPQAVDAALDSLSAVGPVVTVLGCGGDRDQAKRPEMGEAAAARSALTVITDDNPRSEDPATIRAQVLAGARVVAGAAVVEVPGRRAAIEAALRSAPAGGVVAILGKGHERGQILSDHTAPFDDVEEAVAAWRRLQEEGARGGSEHDG
ncbi:UDP-N-acetylmuramoyl-L-alanyl-D-glutamate--2,6-diaminopimelate ligase [Tessaracoccus sp.]|uniref:UDP-N-acetylmuramoyl-L-alanyl-D-glutamate--2, 6-diaminopimelate ligase n=1 Tax=Tessaracoccus sp. TaxID=1971211 RepID=UPI00262EDF76|nr:UDP-N-acetylmuramoyl-L-alanyl-D-glutamate--2,6-diaminopimelate ligase [Tessaracoccus sp.]